jgi:hypothetical protein
MRGVFQAMLVGALVLVIGAGDAVAAGGGKHDRDGKKGRKQDGIELTGIQSFDRVFTRVGEIDRLLSNAEAELRTGKRNLNTALELKKGTPLSDGIAELQDRAGGKLGLAMDGRIPKLETTDAVPSNVQSAVDAVNGLTGNLTTSIADMQSLAPEIERLVKDAQKLPTRLKDEFTRTNGAGLVDMLFKLPKTSKALAHDIEITAGLADRTSSLTSRMTDILGVLQHEFPLVDDRNQERRPAARPQPAKGKKGKGGGGYPGGGSGDGGGGRKKGYGDKR